MSFQPEGPRLSILVVDDNIPLLNLIATSLRLLGNFTVYTAFDGVEGLDCFYRHRPDCVVIDIKMPKLDGNQMIRSIRGDPAVANTSLVVLTALSTDKDRYIGMAAGADLYLVKPIQPLALVHEIKLAISMTQEDRKRQLRYLADNPPLDNPPLDDPPF